MKTNPQTFTLNTAAQNTDLCAKTGIAHGKALIQLLFLPILTSFWQNTDYLLHRCWVSVLETAGSDLMCSCSVFTPEKSLSSSFFSPNMCCGQCCARGPCTWAQAVWWMQSGSLQREAPGSANTTHWLMKISEQMTASLKQPWEQLLLRTKWVISPFSLIVSLWVRCAGQCCKYSFLLFFLNRKIKSWTTATILHRFLPVLQLIAEVWHLSCPLSPSSSVSRESNCLNFAKGIEQLLGEKTNNCISMVRHAA